MKVEHNTISIHFIRTVIDAAKRQGLDHRLLLQTANLNEELLKKTTVKDRPGAIQRANKKNVGVSR